MEFLRQALGRLCKNTVKCIQYAKLMGVSNSTDTFTQFINVLLHVYTRICTYLLNFLLSSHGINNFQALYKWWLQWLVLTKYIM